MLIFQHHHLSSDMRTFHINERCCITGFIEQDHDQLIIILGNYTTDFLCFYISTFLFVHLVRFGVWYFSPT